MSTHINKPSLPRCHPKWCLPFTIRTSVTRNPYALLSPSLALASVNPRSLSFLCLLQLRQPIRFPVLSPIPHGRFLCLLRYLCCWALPILVCAHVCRYRQNSTSILYSSCRSPARGCTRVLQVSHQSTPVAPYVQQHPPSRSARYITA